MSVHSLKPADEAAETPAVDPLRQELRDAIAAKMGLVVRADGLLTAITEAEEDAKKADDLVTSFIDAVATARENDIKRGVAERVSGKAKKLSAPSSCQLRESQLEAEDEAAIAHGVLDKLQDQLADFAEERRWIEVRILRARNGLVAPMIEKVSQRFLEANQSMIRDGALLVALTAEGELPRGFEGEDNFMARIKAEQAINEPLEAAKSAADDARSASSSRALEQHEQRKAIVASVQKALADMLENADAVLPGV